MSHHSRRIIAPVSSVFQRWLTRMQHSAADLCTIASFTLCPFSSWSTQLIVNHNTSLKIDQWTSLGSGGFVWGGARRLVEYLQQQHDKIVWKDLSVIELGAGTGALGLGIAALGAKHVTLTDQVSFEYPGGQKQQNSKLLNLKTRSLLDLLRYNVKENLHHFTNNETRIRGMRQECIHVGELLWGDHKSRLALPLSTYDIIVAADVLLFQEAQVDLLKTLRDLSTCQTIIYIEHTDRASNSGDAYPEDLVAFLELLAEDTHAAWVPRIVQDHGRHITLCIERESTTQTKTETNNANA